MCVRVYSLTVSHGNLRLKKAALDSPTYARDNHALDILLCMFTSYFTLCGYVREWSYWTLWTFTLSIWCILELDITKSNSTSQEITCFFKNPKNHLFSQPTTGPYPESNVLVHILTYSPVSSNRSCLSDFLVKFLMTLLIHSMRATCTIHLIFSDMILIFGKEHNKVESTMQR